MLLVWLVVSFFRFVYFLTFLFLFNFFFTGINNNIKFNRLFCFYMNCARTYTKNFLNKKIYFLLFIKFIVLYLYC